MQISYHFTLTKIQKLQNKKKKMVFFCIGRYARYRMVMPEIGQYGRYGWYLDRYELLAFRYRYTYRYDTYQPVPVWYRLPWSHHIVHYSIQKYSYYEYANISRFPSRFWISSYLDQFNFLTQWRLMNVLLQWPYKTQQYILLDTWSWRCNFWNQSSMKMN